MIEEVKVIDQAPPMFFAHAFDDRVRPENGLLLFLELKKANVPAELHIYSEGGHGFGLRRTDQPCTAWPGRCEEWMRQSGFLKR